MDESQESRATISGVVIAAIMLAGFFVPNSPFAVLVALAAFGSCIFSLLGLFAFAGFASIYGEQKDGRLVLPDNTATNFISTIWIVVSVVASLVGIPILAYVGYVAACHPW